MTDDELRELFAEVGRRFDATAADFRRDLATTAGDLRRDLATTAGDLRQHAQTTAVDLRRHFDVTAEALRGEIRLVAESVQAVDERLGARISDLATETRQGFAETHAMIKFSHAELDRRLTLAESALAELQDLRDRVERIESKLSAS